MSKRWYEVATIRDIDDDEVLQVEADDLFMALYKLEGRFYATSDACQCKDGNLSDGLVEDDRIWCSSCPASFEIRTGMRDGDAKSKSIRRFPVRIDNGLVYVGVDTEKLDREE